VHQRVQRRLLELLDAFFLVLGADGRDLLGQAGQASEAGDLDALVVAVVLLVHLDQPFQVFDLLLLLLQFDVCFSAEAVWAHPKGLLRI